MLEYFQKRRNASLAIALVFSFFTFSEAATGALAIAPLSALIALYFFWLALRK